MFMDIYMYSKSLKILNRKEIIKFMDFDCFQVWREENEIEEGNKEVFNFICIILFFLYMYFWKFKIKKLNIVVLLVFVILLLVMF